jgi:hypothetical protein
MFPGQPFQEPIPDRSRAIGTEIAQLFVRSSLVNVRVDLDDHR